MELKFYLAELYLCTILNGEALQNTPKHFVKYFCSTRFVAILSLCTIILSCIIIHTSIINTENCNSHIISSD